MGLSFPTLRVEQAHFSPLTTCLTTCGDFWLIFGYKNANITNQLDKFFIIDPTEYFVLKAYCFPEESVVNTFTFVFSLISPEATIEAI